MAGARTRVLHQLSRYPTDIYYKSMLVRKRYAKRRLR